MTILDVIKNTTLNNFLTEIKAKFPSGSFDWDGELEFSTVVREKLPPKSDKHGVYIIRCIKTSEIQYIGMAGTLTPSGKYKTQDLGERLKNVKGKDLSANEWARDILANCKNGLKVEYILLPNPTEIAAATVESILLQLFAKEQAIANKTPALPRWNNKL